MAELDEDIELPYAEGIRLGTRVNWHSYVCSMLLVLVGTFLPLAALFVVTFCEAGMLEQFDCGSEGAMCQCDAEGWCDCTGGALDGGIADA